MLKAYRDHVAERAAQGIPPLPLSAKQTGELIELLKNPPKGEEATLVDLITHRVPAGVDDAAKEWEREKFGVETAMKHAEMQLNALSMDTQHEGAEKDRELAKEQAEVSAVASGVERSTDGTRKPINQQSKLADALSKNEERGTKLEEMLAAALKAIQAPKRVIRDNNNRVTGIEPVAVN